MISLERRILKAVMDDKNCHMTEAEYVSFTSMDEVARSLWMGEFMPFRYFGKKIKLFVE
jgi:hypothetical protein